MWKRKYQENRERRIAEDPTYAVRVSQYKPSRTSEENKEYMRAYYAANKHRWRGRTREQRDRYNAVRRRQYSTDTHIRQKLKDASKEWQASHPENRLEQRMRRYGITAADYRRLLAEQGGGCAICGNRDSGDGRGNRLHVDHCHSTDIVRGLLCSSCNFGLGKFEDDPARLERAAMYLRACIGPTGSD